MALNERWHNMAFYCLDHITNMMLTEERLTSLDTVEGYEDGIDYRDFATSLPYMFTDKPERNTFYAEEWVIDQVVDWFGNGAEIKREGDKLIVSVKASPNAMEYWVMQCLNCVEVISPAKLRDKIKDNLKNAIEKYQ